jgi:hypothetical protein
MTRAHDRLHTALADKGYSLVCTAPAANNAFRLELHTNGSTVLLVQIYTDAGFDIFAPTLIFAPIPAANGDLQDTLNAIP